MIISGAFLAARYAANERCILRLDEIVTPVGGDDDSRVLPADAQAESADSILAAQMKSFSDRPPTECVLNATRHLL